jgi:hypothetical protein
MIKIENKTEITSFGGLHLIHQQVMAKQLPSFFNEHLGSRGLIIGASLRLSV